MAACSTVFKMHITRNRFSYPTLPPILQDLPFFFPSYVIYFLLLVSFFHDAIMGSDLMKLINTHTSIVIKVPLKNLSTHATTANPAAKFLYEFAGTRNGIMQLVSFSLEAILSHRCMYQAKLYTWR